MSLLVKSVLATVFLGTGLVATLLMLTLMGRSGRTVSPAALRRLHKLFGAIFLILLLIISFCCLHYVKIAREHLSTRAIFHGVLALTLFIVLVLKILIIQFYREFMRFVPALGLTVFALAFLVYTTSGGYYFLVAGRATTITIERLEDAPATAPSADVQEGGALFAQKCSFCHSADTDDERRGPGLRALLKRQTLPSSGRPATAANLREQLLNPYGNMPSFQGRLTEKQIDALLAYLATL
jgi:mono/diheme cytochrome c family protein